MLCEYANDFYTLSYKKVNMFLTIKLKKFTKIYLECLQLFFSD